MFDVIVIGGGVSGLIASGLMSQKGLKVLLLERMEKPARKLRITGKGRCNITNTADVEGHLEKVKSDKEFVRYALESFDSGAVMRFFESIGVETKVERGGRVFPESESAVDLARKFVNWVESVGVDMRCNSRVEMVKKNDDGVFEVTFNGAAEVAKRVVIACGGASYPSTGSSGDGYGLAYDLGHDIVEVRPSLVPLVVDGCADFVGLELRNVKVDVVIDGQAVDSRFGDVDFSDRGMAGAAVLQLSRLVVDAIGDGKEVKFLVDFKPALSEQKLINRIEREVDALNDATFKVLLQKLLPIKLHSAVVKQVGIPLRRDVKKLSEVDYLKLAQVLKSFEISVIDYRPFSEAIVTAGGVDTTQVDSRTMQSKMVSGLYFSGEVLDVDADTGGYNIQLALSTGALAAKSIENELLSV